MNRYEGQSGIVRIELFIIRPAAVKGKLRFLIDESSN
jgi:hypothetical protein